MLLYIIQQLQSLLTVVSDKVEDTLNNSNDLFLTFRKEMEDMSRKTKRLEKENLTLIRKHDQTNRNILEMAEERTRMSKEMDLLKKKNTNLEKLCRGMQAQGRGVAPVAVRVEGETENENGRTESEYEYDEDEEDDEEEEEDEEDCEDGAPISDHKDERRASMAAATAVEAPQYGPAPPPQGRAPLAPMSPQASQTVTNGSGSGLSRGRTAGRQ